MFQTDRDRRWIHFVPQFRVLASLRQVAAEELGEASCPLPALALPEAREKLRLAVERRRALLQFRYSFPPEISRHVGRIPNEQWQILRLLRREKGTLDLLAINPALVFSLAIAARNEAQFCLLPNLGELRQRELAF